MICIPGAPVPVSAPSFMMMFTCGAEGESCSNYCARNALLIIVQIMYPHDIVGDPIAYVAETEAELEEAKSKAGGGGGAAAAPPPPPPPLPAAAAPAAPAAPAAAAAVSRFLSRPSGSYCTM